MSDAQVRAQAVQDVHDMLLDRFGYPKLSPLMQAIRDYRDEQARSSSTPEKESE